jgi:hypothetical protein
MVVRHPDVMHQSQVSNAGTWATALILLIAAGCGQDSSETRDAGVDYHFGTFLPDTLSVSPAVGHFPSTPVAARSAATTFTISNIGTITSGTITVSFGGDAPGDFVVTSSACDHPLAPNDECTLSMVFAPTAAGARTARLTAMGLPSAFFTLVLDGTGLP